MADRLLPPLLRGRRRLHLVQLVLLALGQAGLGVALAWTVIQLQEAPTAQARAWAVAALVLTVLSVGALRAHERVVAERLGQDYVRHVRRRLVRAALTPGAAGSLGVTVARTTNDLTAVRNWVSQGVAPLVVAVPLLLGVLGAFAWLDWRLALGALVPVAVLGAGVAVWAGPAFETSRALRRTRGRMASRIAETVTAADSIVAAGGRRREVRNVDELSAQVVDRAVERAGVLGLLRATGIVAASMMTLVAVVVDATVGLGTGVVVGAMALAGIAAAPLTDLGRVVEFRQSFLAARVSLRPALARAEDRRRQEQAHRERLARTPGPELADGLVQVRLAGLQERPLTADAGSVLSLEGAAADVAEAVARLAGLALPPQDAVDIVRVDGRDLAEGSSRRRREAVGVASAGAAFERGSVLRAARYRRPDLPTADAAELLDAVGLTADTLPEGHRTRLRQGGRELTVDQRARLSLARASLGAPGLLVVDGLERDLDPPGRTLLVQALGDHPGVVLLAGCPETAAALDAEALPVGPPADTADTPDTDPHREATTR